MLPHWHDLREKTSQTCTLLNNNNSSTARIDRADATTRVMEERERLHNGD